MIKAPKTKKQVAEEIRLDGIYCNVFEVGDFLIRCSSKGLSNVKDPNILEVKRVLTMIGGGSPSYQLWSEKLGKRFSVECDLVDTRFRKLSSLESAIFLDVLSI